MKRTIKRIGLLATFIAVLAFSFVFVGNALKPSSMTFADEPETSEVTVSEEVTSEPEEQVSEAVSSTQQFDPESAVKDATSKVYDWLGNTVVPIFGGITLLSILTTVGSIVGIILKYRGDNKIRALVKLQDGKIAEMEVMVEKLEAKNEVAVKALEEGKLTLSDASTAIEHVGAFAKTMCEQVANQNVRIEQVEKLGNSIEAICNLTAKVISLSEDAVKSGIAEEAKAIVDNMVGGDSNGEQS